MFVIIICVLCLIMWKHVCVLRGSMHNVCLECVREVCSACVRVSNMHVCVCLNCMWVLVVLCQCMSIYIYVYKCMYVYLCACVEYMCEYVVCGC